MTVQVLSWQQAIDLFVGQEVEQLSKLVAKYTENSALGDLDGVSDVYVPPLFTCNPGSQVLQNYIDVQHQLTFFTISENILLAEVDTISGALSGTSPRVLLSPSRHASMPLCRA